jgi:hypothetical protein
VDLRLSQTFKFREKQRIYVAVDAFNAFNRPNVDEVDSSYCTYNFCGGVVPNHYKDAATGLTQLGTAGACPGAAAGVGPPAPNGDFGAPRKMFNARQLQISLKYSF